MLYWEEYSHRHFKECKNLESQQENTQLISGTLRSVSNIKTLQHELNIPFPMLQRLEDKLLSIHLPLDVKALNWQFDTPNDQIMLKRKQKIHITHSLPSLDIQVFQTVQESI